MTIQRRVLVHLAEHGKLTLREIVSAIDEPTSDVAGALGRLQLAGRVSTEKSKYGITGYGMEEVTAWARSLSKQR